MKSLAPALLATTLAAALAMPAHADAPKKDRSVIVPAAELTALYSNKTWVWKSGAGYFAPDKTFRAWSHENGATSYAEGDWVVTGDGQMCFRAVWSYPGGKKPAVTCFSHRKTGNVVFQRSEPKGSWYVFRNNPAKPSDEARKLVPGDRVQQDFARAKAAVAG